MTPPAEDPAGLPPPPWRLAPGLRVVRRGRGQLQVGLHPERRVVLPDDARSRRLLHALATGTAPAPDALDTPRHAALARLHRLRMLRPPYAGRARVAVHAPGWPLDVVDLLAGAGLRPVRTSPDAVLVLGRGEPDRALLDPLVRDGTTHLVAALLDGGVRLGPLVQPGSTACLRCVDGHLSAADPDHVPVLLRYAEADRGLEDGTDLATVALATGWAVRDLARHLHGLAPRPATWSSTLTWHPGTDEPVPRRWLRHPGCGCGWTCDTEDSRDAALGPGSDDPRSGTMET